MSAIRIVRGTRIVDCRRSRPAPAFILFATLLGAGVAPSAAEIKWRNPAPAIATAPPGPERGPTGAAVRALLGSGAEARMVVQLDRPVDAATRAALDAAGVTLLSYLGEWAFFATVTRARFDEAALDRIGAVRSVCAIETAWKVHPLLWSGPTPEWAVVGAAPDGSPIVGVYVLLHADAALAVGEAAVAARPAARVRDRVESIGALVVELPASQVTALAAEDFVQWIEPALPRMSTLNAENRALTGADLAQAPPYSLDGSGVTVLVYDGGTARATHVDFSGRLTVHDASGQSTHATHVSGTVGGDGTASAGANRGMAPAVKIVSYGLEVSGGGIFLYTNPGDLEADYKEAITTLGADVANNSIGTNVESNGFPCSMQGDYGLTDALIDAIVRGSLGSPLRVVFAGGNERQGSDCDVEGFGDYYSIAPPAGAKNHITVGAINADDESMTSFSSWGPVDDGRLKPDLTAPGCQITGDGGVTSCSAASTTAYTVACGTSMASPTLVGLASLLLEDYRAHFPGPDPRNSTLKILFAHNAVDLGNPGPDYQFGYGSVRIQPTIDFMRLGQFFEDQLGQGAAATYAIQVPPGAPQLKVTLAWDDVPGTANVVQALINDLDLRVLDPNGVQHFPWTLNPLNPGAPAVKSKADHLNNIEQVLVNNPAAGEWKVQVVGYDVPVAPQPFSICAGPNIEPQGVKIELPGGVPVSVAPGESLTIPVEIVAAGESVVPGTETLHYRFGAGPFLTSALRSVGPGAYEAELPAATCGATPELYVSAAGTQSGVLTNPVDAPASVYSLDVGVSVVFVSDDFEAESGWVSGAPGDDATTGQWNRMDPQGTAAQPAEDHTPGAGVACWVTDGVAGSGIGSFDVDGGKTTLLSPVYDLSRGVDPVVSYWRWYSNDAGAAPNQDVFVVDVTADGATWVNVETVGPGGAGTSGGWLPHAFHLTDFVALSPTIRFRFVAQDAPPGSLVEAALDDFLITDFVCDAPPCPADLDGDGEVSQSDLGILLSAYERGPEGDVDGDGDTDQADLGALLAGFEKPCP